MNAVNKNLENKKMRSEILELRKTLLNLKFQKSKLFQLRIEKSFETLFLSTSKTFV